MIQRRRVDELWRSRDFRALIFLGVLGVLTLVLAFAIRGILGPFILAGVVAMMLNPAVNAAERHSLARSARSEGSSAPSSTVVCFALDGARPRRRRPASLPASSPVC